MRTPERDVLPYMYDCSAVSLDSAILTWMTNVAQLEKESRQVAEELINIKADIQAARAIREFRKRKAKEARHERTT